MSFAWDRWNRRHLEKHAVSPQEAQFVVEHRQPPYPLPLGGGKFVVRGRTGEGRYLQVIYVFRSDEDLDFEEMDIEDIIDLSDAEAPYYYVIHARDLTAREKRRFKQGRQ